MAREELAEMVSPLTAVELLVQLKKELTTEIALVPGIHQSKFRKYPAFIYFKKKIGRLALFHLAWLYANQNIDQADLEQARTIYAWCEKKYGLENFSQMALTDLALLSIRTGDLDLARRAVGRANTKLAFLANFQPRALRMKPALGLQEALNIFFGFSKDLTIRKVFLVADVANPFRGKSWEAEIVKPQTHKWLKELSSAVLPSEVAELAFAQEPALSAFDSLSVAGELARVSQGPKVTVVMSAYKPTQHLLSAARSVLASTYDNLELLIIDDASGAEFDGILKTAASLDPRVKVLRQEQNGGTYRIRNRALDEATGELMTFNDSDDWMHPQRLEKQVSKLLGSNRIGNISMSTRLTDNLEGAESIRRLRIGLCEPSLLFWKDRAKDKIGYFDSVRKGGDSEYRRRLERAFGQDLDVIDPYRCLTIQRADNGGLTQGDLGFRWIVDFRLNYRDSFNYSQSKNKDLFIPNTDERKFYAPGPMRFSRSQQTETKEYDLVIGANGHDPQNSAKLIEIAKQAVAEGKKVGFWQVSSMYPIENPRTLRSGVLELLNTNQMQSVYASDRLKTKKLLLIAPSSFLNSYYPLGYNWQISDRERLSFEQAPESWRAEGPGIDSLVDERFASLG
jgi:glycosyltransferase involved in cell wall biosynthesis